MRSFDAILSSLASSKIRTLPVAIVSFIVTRPSRKRLRPTPSIVHVCVLMFVVRDRIRAETGKSFVLDDSPRTLRPAQINSASRAAPGAVRRPAAVAPDEALQHRLLAPGPAPHAGADRRCHY